MGNEPNNSQSNKEKKYIYIAIAGAVLLLVLFLLFRDKDTETSVEEDFIANPPAEQIIPPTSTPSSTAKTTTQPSKRMVSPLSATQKYLDALKTYKTVGYYFQFVDCHGLPGTLTMKKGKKFMLDNRDAKGRRIAISGGQSFKIGAYNFAIATAPSKAGTHYITCDGGGAATIVVQP